MLSTHIVTCDGPPLDYTTRANLHRAGVAVVSETPVLRMQVEAASPDAALGLLRGVLAARPYDRFRVAPLRRAA